MPSCWEQQGFGNYNYGRDYKTNGKNARFYDEQGIYKYQFKVPATWNSKVVEFTYSGNMKYVKWKINASGWVTMNYEHSIDGDHPFSR